MARAGRVLQYANLARKLLAAKFSQRPWPISVSYNVTRFCNLRCAHCYAMLEQLDQPDASLEQVLEVVDGLHKGGTLSIRLLGGEPLVRKDLPKVINRIKAHGMFCEVVTNGTLLRQRIAQWPELARVDSFSVSLDGDPTLHDQIRGAGVFEQTMDGVFALLEAGYPVRLHAALAGDSFDHDPAPHKFLAGLSKTHDVPFNVATYCPSPCKDAQQDKQNRASFRQSQQVYRDLLQYKTEGVLVSTTKSILEKGIAWFDRTDRYILFGDESAIPPGHKKCQAGVRNCFIDSDGGMYSCIPNWKQGISVYEEGVPRAVEYMYTSRQKVGCQLCYNLAQWEYSAFFTFSNPRLLLNMARNVGRLLLQRRRGRRTRLSAPPAKRTQGDTQSGTSLPAVEPCSQIEPDSVAAEAGSRVKQQCGDRCRASQDNQLQECGTGTD